MEKRSVLRLVAVTADGDHPDLPWVFSKFIKPCVLKKYFVDIEKIERYLKEEYKGPVKYTIVRPFELKDGEKGSYRVGGQLQVMEPKWSGKSWTGDVAEFCVKCFEEACNINEFVSIGE